MGVPYLGDFNAQQSIHYKFPSTINGRPVAPSSLTVKVYQDDATGSEVTTGVTVTLTHDTLTGINHLKVAITDAFYATGHDYFAVVTTGTLGGITVTDVLCSWSILNRSVQLADAVFHGGPTATLELGAADGPALYVHADAGDAVWFDAPGGAAFFADGAVAWQLGSSGGVGLNITAQEDFAFIINGFPLDRFAEVMSANEKGTAQSATATTIRLAADASAVDDYYKNSVIVLTAGPGAGSTPRRILAYNGTTKDATVADWATQPTSGTNYMILGLVE